MPDKKLEQDFKNLSAANDYLELARQDAIALAESFKQERDQLREAAEKLAEALEFMTMPITGDQLTIESLLQTMANDDERGKQALAEYRKQFPKAKNDF